MNSAFSEYLDSIGVRRVVRNRLEEILHFYHEISPEEITDIFVTDQINEDGMREFVNFWLFSKSFAMEAKEFVSKDDFDITPIRNRAIHLIVEKQDYDFVEATTKSRLHVYIKFDTGITGNFKATQGNCDSLRDICRKHFLPNLSS